MERSEAAGSPRAPIAACRGVRIAGAAAALAVTLGCSKPDAGATGSAPAFCARKAADAVHDFFCDPGQARVSGLLDIEQRLGFTAVPPAGGPDAGNAAGSYASGASIFTPAVLLAHSTALSGRLVSPINPRVVLLASTTLLAFHRGVQEVELASLDRDASSDASVFNFYLVTFEQACNDAPKGCSPGNLFTPRVESSWLRVHVQDAEDLKDTPLDCRQCHQRGRATPTLLMRELEGPWTHFFGPDQPTEGFPEASGSDLLRDYLSAKGDEGYGGLETDVVRNTIGQNLEQAVPNLQPLKFDGPQILGERWPYDPDAGYAATPQRSATWYAAFDAFRRGEALALPYFDPRATDPAKQAALSEAYRRYRSGQTPAEALPDLADIHSDDPQVRAEIGLQTEPGATPAQTLVQACGACHNDVLDQGISRARFNVALSRMGRPELDQAIARLELPRGGAGAMPPAVTRQLDPAGIAALVDYLHQDVRSADDDALLERAARLGMAGGAPASP